MSCGNPHETDCSEVLERVFLYLDGELPPEAEQDVREHLDECAPCLRQYGLEQAVKALVARSCGCDPVPEELRTKVLSWLSQVRVEISQVEFRVD